MGDYLAPSVELKMLCIGSIDGYCSWDPGVCAARVAGCCAAVDGVDGVAVCGAAGPGAARAADDVGGMDGGMESATTGRGGRRRIGEEVDTGKGEYQNTI